VSKFFIDTNVLIYANDPRDESKQTRAIQLIGDLVRSGEGVLSTQVLQEYAHAAMSKLGMAEEIVLRQIHLLEKLEVICQSPSMIRRAVEIRKTYGVQFWDACIIANAESAECDLIYSEDFNTGRYYSGIRVVNPFDE